MLYCPKCQQTYENACQRFCLNDGGRLLPASSTGKSANQTSSVFTSILNRKTGDGDDKFSSAPSFSKTDRTQLFQPEFRPPTVSKIFKSEPKIESDEKIKLQAVIESKPPVLKPAPRLINPYEAPTSQTQLDDRKTNPTSRQALTRENPKALHGQIVKGRYQVIEQISEVETGITFLAKDKLVADKKVIVRVLIDEDADDILSNKIFAEERVSFSHINHPNIVSIIDSGELLEGKPFIITESVEGESVEDYLKKLGPFDALRAVKIIQQASYALSEIHKIGVLHGNLKPENLILTVNENGVEQVKLTNFVGSKNRLDEKNLAYKSPEQIEGGLASFASDNYSLAVIAYQMLTGRLPFNAASVGDLLKAQREGITLYPTNLRLELPPLVNEILEKALAFSPSERYLNVPDFGDALFNAIANEALLYTKETEGIEVVTGKTATGTPISVPSSLLISGLNEDTPVKSDDINLQTRAETTTENLAWENHSPEMPNEPTISHIWLSIFGVATLLLVLWGVWSYFSNHSNKTNFAVQTPTKNVYSSNQATEVLSPITDNAPILEGMEIAPLPRTIAQPPDTVYFQNSKESLKDDALKNFLGFSLYYPKDWKINETSRDENDTKSRSKFIDISRNAPSGTPIEQMMVSYYNSKGTFKADAEIFTSLVDETNTTLKKIIPSYKMVSGGEKIVNNGWRAYEVKFEGTGRTVNGDEITLWGRRLFVPTATRYMENGYVITMLATSLSKEVKSVDDVGVKGELSKILETFEPNQNF